MTEYLENYKYLPKLNNERRPEQRNYTYKDRFTSLRNLVLVKVRSPQKNHYLPVKLIESSLDDPVLLYSLKTIRSLFQIRWTIIRVKPESWCRQIRCALSPKPTVFRTKTFQTKEAFASLKEQNTHHMLYACSCKYWKKYSDDCVDQ